LAGTGPTAGHFETAAGNDQYRVTAHFSPAQRRGSQRSAKRALIEIIFSVACTLSVSKLLSAVTSKGYTRN